MPQSTCSVDECESDKIMARGLCSPHYKRWYRYGDPTAGQPLRTPRPETCEAEGCERKTDRLKWCGKHYMRLLRHGDPLGGRDRLPAPASCIREGCGKPGPYSRGLCSMHLARVGRGAKPNETRACVQCGAAIALYPDGANGRKRNGAVASCDSCRKAPNPITVSELIARDGRDCGLCGQGVDESVLYPDPLSGSVDHVTPRSRGGSNTAENCQLAHLVCNLRKNNRIG